MTLQTLTNVFLILTSLSNSAAIFYVIKAHRHLMTAINNHTKQIQSLQKYQRF